MWIRFCQLSCMSSGCPNGGPLTQTTFSTNSYTQAFEIRNDHSNTTDVADDQVGDVVIAPYSFEWLYNPYDGGADVFLPSILERDTLSQSHADWLSPYESGL